jgi:hypothetical protein
MKNYAILLMVFASVFTISAKSLAQNVDTSTYKYKLTKTWNYNFSESFGVKTNPDSTQKHDLIIFKPNLTYQMTLNGVNSMGTWNVSENTHFLTMSDSKTRRTCTIKILGLIKDQLALKWQDPADLTSVNKYYSAK